MADRRQGDRRDKENGIIRIKLKDAVIYIILIAIIVVSLIANIVQYKKIKNLIQMIIL